MSSSNLYDEMTEAQSDRIENPTRKPNRMVQILDAMSDDDRVAVLKALANEEISSNVIMNILHKNDWKVSYDQVRRFRNGTYHVPDRYQPTKDEDSK